jgi:hypothetical protein
MFRHDNAWPHVARICAQFLEAENVPVLPWPECSTFMSPIEHVWVALDRCLWQHVPVPANIQKLHTAFEEEWDNMPQLTALSTLYEGNCCAARGKYMVTPDTDWFSDPLPYLFSFRYLWPTDAYLYSQSCEIHRLRPNECISIDWFSYVNFNSVKSLKLLHVAFIYILFSILYSHWQMAFC